MLIEVTRTDLLKAIKSTGGPDTYALLFARVGQFSVNSKWVWFTKVLNDMDDYQLLELYRTILEFKRA